ncbi:MAG: outer rane efflux protein [Edaphobacter sp.]|nr:outer rane efflux protein [Edaphobacter sp.]
MEWAIAPGKLGPTEKPLIDPPAGFVRIKIEACGVCHSDSSTVEVSKVHFRSTSAFGRKSFELLLVSGATGLFDSRSKQSPAILGTLAPPGSRKRMRFEDLLQVQLLDRSGRTVRPTDVGEVYLQYAAWERTRVAAASVSIAKSELYRTVLAAAGGRTFKNPPLLYQSFVLQDIGTFETALTLNYTLVDFGARRDEISSAQAHLLAANLNFNNEHLILIQQVSSAYYNLLNASGLRKAAEVNLNDARAIEDAASERKANGLATLPDVLEARAATAKADYDLQSALGAKQTAFGDLATIMTTSPTKSFKVQELDEIHIREALDQSVEDAIASAYKTWPDLLADIERVRAADAEVKYARSAYFPKLAFDGSKGWLRAWGQQEQFAGTYAKTYTYDARLSLTWVAQLPGNRSRAEQRGSCYLWGYQPMPNAICSGCGVAIVVLWLLLSS